MYYKLKRRWVNKNTGLVSTSLRDVIDEEVTVKRNFSLFGSSIKPFDNVSPFNEIEVLDLHGGCRLFNAQKKFEELSEGQFFELDLDGIDGHAVADLGGLRPHGQEVLTACCPLDQLLNE